MTEAEAFAFIRKHRIAIGPGAGDAWGAAAMVEIEVDGAKRAYHKTVYGTDPLMMLEHLAEQIREIEEAIAREPGAAAAANPLYLQPAKKSRSKKS